MLNSVQPVHVKIKKEIIVDKNKDNINYVLKNIEKDKKIKDLEKLLSISKKITMLQQFPLSIF